MISEVAVGINRVRWNLLSLPVGVALSMPSQVSMPPHILWAALLCAAAVIFVPGAWLVVEHLEGEAR